ncbi:hypothetical protein P691DRAFT_786707 [Macrolepiota fuliginosa MF-IS2]|uniref:Uncharacterized protein n=1 Tax=Macrolepiota fuliginosa MF-IS2 TaxID=1400762 RepID=A0A9P6BVJ2_9AGAR|nr:hypothetical protein P691DRAFT_786707 [Macrolepiota fuliginosa MF-IS2]
MEDKTKARQSESITAPSKLFWHTSGRATPYVEVEIPREKRRRAGEDEKENIVEENNKVDVSETSLLKTTQGDIQTQVKEKSAGAKARELYSDSENEVSGIAKPKATGVRLKEKTKAQKEMKLKSKLKPRYGKKPNKLESSLEGGIHQ